MKDNFTLLSITEKKNQLAESQSIDSTMAPSENTLRFLKLFARNYQVENSLPEGLQDIVLS